MVRRVLRVLVTVLLIGGAAGCQDDPEPKVDAPPGATATPSVSPSGSVPTPMAPSPTAPSPSATAEPDSPIGASEDSGRGARAFIRWWIELINFAQRTGNSTRLTSVMNADDAGCAGILRAIDEPYSQGGHIVGGAWRVTRLRPLPLDHGADWAGFLDVTTEPQAIFDADGSAVKHPGGRAYVSAYLVWANDQWRVTWVRTAVSKD